MAKTGALKKGSEKTSAYWPSLTFPVDVGFEGLRRMMASTTRG
jgi:hypothetical protein